MSPPETRIQELNLTLPSLPKPLAKYRMAVRHGELLYLSGHLPVLPDGTFIKGKIGADMKPEAGYAAARQVGLAVLSTLRSELGSLNKVKRLVKTMGLVNATAEFIDHPKVINGFSELMAEVFGEEAGVGARSAFGAGSLPGNAAAEIECVFVVE
jgi:enamine deaminase RidA (YjgF/YER057c/UK114 family)